MRRRLLGLVLGSMAVVLLGLAAAALALAALLALRLATLERERCFAADVSHQLRNPLSALLLRLDALPTPEAEAAAREGRHLADVLERLTHGEPLPGRVDIVPIVEQRIDAWSAAALAKRMTISRAGGTRVEALADAVALSSALDVVLDNAVKYAPPGSAVRVSVRCEADGAVVSVEDEGPGLRPDELRRAGDRHWRGRRDTEGSGLGLAIARNLLMDSGARIDIRPGTPRGLEVLLRFTASA